MTFVLDASVACAWVFADEASQEVDDLLDRATTEEVIVPQLWRSEVLNTLIQAEKRGRITQSQIFEFWSYLEALGIKESSYSPNTTRIVDLCKKHSLTAYDAYYLELALWLQAPLATRDKNLIQAAKIEGISTLGHP